MRILLGSLTFAFASVLYIGCGSADTSPVGQSTEALGATTSSRGTPASGAVIDPICPKGEKVCTFGPLGGAGPCTKECVPDDVLCVALPGECGCPAGEKICKVGGPTGCRDVCVIDTALCVAPPECSGFVCDKLCIAGDACCPGPTPGSSVCLPKKDLDDGKCPPLP